MICIRATGLGLRYRLPRRFSLAPRSFCIGAATEGGDVHGNSSINALDSVTFSATAGDRIGLVGANGAGKTTLLKVLYGIYKPTHGTMLICGKVDALFNINLGFRREATGRRNIIIRGLINGWTREEIEARIEEIVEFSELGEFIDLPYKTYSQGMAARLAFSIATSLDPEILLMDEWIGAGDPAFQAKAKERMNELSQRARIIVLASHNYGLLKSTCTKILELERGRVKSFESADTWFSRSKL